VPLPPLPVLLSQLHESNGDLLPVYLARYESAATRRSYGRDLRAFFGTETVTLPRAQHVTFVDVNLHVEAMERRGLSSGTIRGRLRVLNAFFGWLVALRLLPRNPADRHVVRRPPRSDFRTRPVRALTKEEVRALLGGVNPRKWTAVRDRALITVLVVCGLRRAEAHRLDFQHLREFDGCWVLDVPEAKGGPDQWFGATGAVVEALASVREAYGFDAGPVFRKLRPGPRYAERMSEQAVYTAVKTAASRAGLEGVSTHTLRHTCCTLAFEGGASLVQVKNHARHQSIETTMVYLHLRDRLAQSAADFIRV
jgi:integrase